MSIVAGIVYFEVNMTAYMRIDSTSWFSVGGGRWLQRLPRTCV